MSESTTQPSIDIEALSKKKAEEVSFADLVNQSKYILIQHMFT